MYHDHCCLSSVFLSVLEVISLFDLGTCRFCSFEIKHVNLLDVVLIIWVYFSPFTPRVKAWANTFGCTVWVCGWNPSVWPFKWKISSSIFTWFCLFFTILQSEIFDFFPYFSPQFLNIALLGVKGLMHDHERPSQSCTQLKQLHKKSFIRRSIYDISYIHVHIEYIIRILCSCCCSRACVNGDWVTLLEGFPTYIVSRNVLLILKPGFH